MAFDKVQAIVRADKLLVVALLFLFFAINYSGLHSFVTLLIIYTGYVATTKLWRRQILRRHGAETIRREHLSTESTPTALVRILDELELQMSKPGQFVLHWAPRESPVAARLLPSASQPQLLVSGGLAVVATRSSSYAKCVLLHEMSHHRNADGYLRFLIVIVVLSLLDKIVLNPSAMAYALWSMSLVLVPLLVLLRRREYLADLVASTVLGRQKTYLSCLATLDSHRRSVFHPSMDKRVAALKGIPTVARFGPTVLLVCIAVAGLGASLLVSPSDPPLDIFELAFSVVAIAAALGAALYEAWKLRAPVGISSLNGASDRIDSDEHLTPRRRYLTFFEDLARSGSIAWNEWRARHPTARPDLREIDLRDANLANCDFSDLDLSCSDLSLSSLHGADVSGTCFKGARLACADLTDATGTQDADFGGADLRDTVFDSYSLWRSLETDCEALVRVSRLLVLVLALVSVGLVYFTFSMPQMAELLVTGTHVFSLLVYITAAGAIATTTFLLHRRLGQACSLVSQLPAVRPDGDSPGIGWPVGSFASIWATSGSARWAQGYSLIPATLAFIGAALVVLAWLRVLAWSIDALTGLLLLVCLALVTSGRQLLDRTCTGPPESAQTWTLSVLRANGWQLLIWSIPLLVIWQGVQQGVYTELRWRLYTFPSGPEVIGCSNRWDDVLGFNRILRGQSQEAYDYRVTSQAFVPLVLSRVGFSPFATIESVNATTQKLAFAPLRGSFMKQVDASNSSWRSANLSLSVIEEFSAAGSDLSGANLSGACVWQANLDDATLERVDFRGVRFHGVECRRCDFSGAEFGPMDVGPYVLNSEWWGGDLDESTFAGADLRGASFHGDLAHADFRAARLGEATDGSTTDFGLANLKSADFRRVNFGRTKLRRAQMFGTDLRGAVLRDVFYLTEEQYSSALTDDRTVPPSRWNRPEFEWERP